MTLDECCVRSTKQLLREEFRLLGCDAVWLLLNTYVSPEHIVSNIRVNKSAR
jgi:hypothetical protein